MPWSELSAPTVIGYGSGWVAFFALAFMWFRSLNKGEWVQGAVYDRAVEALERRETQFDHLLETHRETTEQNTELLETARFTKAVTQAADRLIKERQS